MSTSECTPTIPTVSRALIISCFMRLSISRDNLHNTFVDGFAVAKKLFMEDQHSFDLLANTPVRWENNGGDGTSSFVKYAPYIEVEPREKYSSVGTLDGLSHPPILFYGLMNSLEL